MPRWLLLTILPFLDGDVDAVWNLLGAIGHENILNDDAVCYFVIE